MKFIRKYLGQLYLSDRFFIATAAVVGLFALAFKFGILFPIAKLVLAVFVVVVFVDYILLFNGGVKVLAQRRMAKLLSLGDANKVSISVFNAYGMPLSFELIDEIPDQLQDRDFSIRFQLGGGEREDIVYPIVPNVRGVYKFGKLHTYLSTMIGLVSRRYTHDLQTETPVYPSIIQMKKFELKAFAKISQFHGIKKIRRIGHSYEFEQVKNYVRGDDYRSINWKATGRRAELMVNQYDDEKAQQIYSLVDKSRVMKLPFNGLTLMDHAINTSLVISNVALLKHDKAGLLTFSDKIGGTVKADRKKNQLKMILESLYKQKERDTEADYELLLHAMNKFITNRSLIFLYTNFESIYSLERVLPILRRINRQHLLVVMFFQNTEIVDYTDGNVKMLSDIYTQTIARKFVYEKNQIVQELRKYGIQSVLTRPENLSLNTVNKYLELKARGMI